LYYVCDPSLSFKLKVALYGKFSRFPSLRMFLIVMIKVEPIVDAASGVKMSSRTTTIYDRTVTATELVNGVIE
jgi:hypothetical protein